MKKDLNLPNADVISEVGKLSVKTAKWLVKELDFQEDLPDELERNLWHRLCFELNEFLTTYIFLLCNKDSISLDHAFYNNPNWSNIARRIGQSICGRFKDELERYKTNNKEGMEETILNAKRGDWRSIYKLVTWDKAWLGTDFIQAKIIECQQRGDLLFFRRLADAVGKKSGIKKKAKEEHVIWLVQLMSYRYDLTIEGGLKSLHNDLVTAGVLYDTDEIKPITEYKYFRKVLKRHSII